MGQSGSVRQSDTGTVGTVRQSGCPIFSISLNLNDRASKIIFFQLGGCLNDRASDIGKVGQSESRSGSSDYQNIWIIKLLGFVTSECDMPYLVELMWCDMLYLVELMCLMCLVK